MRLPQILRDNAVVRTSAGSLGTVGAISRIGPSGLPRPGLRGYPVIFSCNSRYLNGIGFLDVFGFKFLSIR